MDVISIDIEGGWTLHGKSFEGVLGFELRNASDSTLRIDVTPDAAQALIAIVQAKQPPPP